MRRLACRPFTLPLVAGFIIGAVTVVHPANTFPQREDEKFTVIIDEALSLGPAFESLGVGSVLRGRMAEEARTKSPASVLTTTYQGLIQYFGGGDINNIAPDVLLRLGQGLRRKDCFETVLRNHADTLLTRNRRGFDSGANEQKAGLSALLGLSQISDSPLMKVKYLRQAIERFPNERVGGGSGLVKTQLVIRVAMILQKDPATLSEALDEYHHLIRTYPDVRVAGYEYSYLVGDYAARLLIQALGNSSPEVLLSEATKIAEEAQGKEARAIAYDALVKANVALKKYEPAESALEKALELSPSVIAIREIGMHYLGELGAPQRLINLSDRLLVRLRETAVRDRLHYAKAFALDFGPGKRNEVLAEYEKSSMRDFMQPNRTADWTMSRSEEIRTDRPFNAVFVMPAEIRTVPKGDAPIVQKASRGQEARVLYRNRSFFSGKWVKLEMEDGTRGWAPEHAIRAETIRSLPKFLAENAWSQYRANAQQTGAIRGPRITKPELLWNIPNVNAHEIIYTDANKDGITDLIVAGYKMNQIAALSGRDQSEIWSHSYGTSQRYGPNLERFRPANAPSIWKNWVVFASPGAIQWIYLSNGLAEKTLGPNPYFSPPRVSGHHLFFKEYLGPLVAYDLSAHKSQWKSPGRTCNSEAPAVDAKSELVITCHFKPTDSPIGPRTAAVAFSVGTGEEAWWFGTDDISGFQPGLISAVPEGILLGEWKGLYLLSGDSGKISAKLNPRNGYPASENLAVQGDTVVVKSSFPNQLNAFSLKDRKLLWSFPVKAHVRARLAISGDTVYAGDDAGILYAVDLRTGKELWHFDAGDQIWGAVSTNGNLVSFTTKTNALFVLGDAPTVNDN